MSTMSSQRRKLSAFRGKKLSTIVAGRRRKMGRLLALGDRINSDQRSALAVIKSFFQRQKKG